MASLSYWLQEALHVQHARRKLPGGHGVMGHELQRHGPSGDDAFDAPEDLQGAEWLWRGACEGAGSEQVWGGVRRV